MRPSRRRRAREPERPAPPAEPGRTDGLLRAGQLAWSLLGIAAVTVLAWVAVSRLAVVVVPLLLALFPAAALAPLVQRMVCRGVPRILAVLLVLVGLLAAVAGVIAAVIPQFVSQLPALADSVSRSVQQLQPLLNRVPGLTGGVSWQDVAQRWGGLGGGSALRTAVGYTSSVVEFLGGLLLLLIALFVYLWDGQRLARGALHVLPRRHRHSAVELGDQLWRTLGDFFRAQCTVALVDAVLIGAGLALLGVPLVIPLAVVVFLGAFFPYIGATASGLLAVIVAFADGGPGSAAAVLALVLGVQILEGNLIEPYIAGRMVRVRPFAVIVAVAVGGTLLGVLGAFLAVPAAACLARVVTFFQRDEDADSGSSAATPMHNPAPA